MFRVRTSTLTMRNGNNVGRRALRLSTVTWKIKTYPKVSAMLWHLHVVNAGYRGCEIPLTRLSVCTGLFSEPLLTASL